MSPCSCRPISLWSTKSTMFLQCNRYNKQWNLIISSLFSVLQSLRSSSAGSGVSAQSLTYDNATYTTILSATMRNDITALSTVSRSRLYYASEVNGIYSQYIANIVHNIIHDTRSFRGFACQYVSGRQTTPPIVLDSTNTALHNLL